ncbi:MAG: NTP transferase domain-containing protein, partial [Candidatus Adiutrix sp.]|nr:NTP transferase domain-containing protein [Candidatus Adiutrix sp.]
MRPGEFSGRPLTGGLENVSAAILCGGQSRRMGFDKALGLRNREGRPLLAALAGELAAHFGEVLLVTNDAAKLAAINDLRAYRAV